MKNTINYNFNLPEQSDFYNIEHMNENFNKLDNDLKQIENSITKMFDIEKLNTEEGFNNLRLKDGELQIKNNIEWVNLVSNIIKGPFTNKTSKEIEKMLEESSYHLPMQKSIGAYSSDEEYFSNYYKEPIIFLKDRVIIHTNFHMGEIGEFTCEEWDFTFEEYLRFIYHKILNLEGIKDELKGLKASITALQNDLKTANQRLLQSIGAIATLHAEYDKIQYVEA